MKPRKGRVAPTKRELWAAHTLWASGCEDQARLQKAVEELGIAEPRQRVKRPSTKPKGATEQQIVNSILHMLRLHPRVAMAWRQNVGMAEFDGQPVRFGFVGQPDICGFMVGGRALFLEAKRPGCKLTPAQAHFLSLAKEAGCIAAMVTSVDEAAAVLKEAGAWA